LVVWRQDHRQLLRGMWRQRYSVVAICEVQLCQENWTVFWVGVHNALEDAKKGPAELHGWVWGNWCTGLVHLVERVVHDWPRSSLALRYYSGWCQRQVRQVLDSGEG